MSQQSGLSSSSKRTSQAYPVWVGLGLFVGSLALLFLLPDRNTDEPLRHGPPIASLKTRNRDVHSKPQGLVVWSIPKEGTRFYEKDSIATLSGSQATLIFADESELLLDSDTLIVIEKGPEGSWDGSGSREGKIITHLIRGTIEHRTKSGVPMVLESDSVGSPPLMLKTGEGTENAYRVRATEGGVEVRVETGNLSLGGKTLKALEGVKIKKGKDGRQNTDILPAGKSPLSRPKIKVEKPGQPGGFYKTIDRLFDFFSDFLTVASAHAAGTPATLEVKLKLKWEMEQGEPSPARYRIQIANDPFFQDKLVDREIKSKEVDQTFRTPAVSANYYFRVAGVTQDGELGEFSETESFEINPDQDNKGKAQGKTSGKGTITKIAVN
ncbi:MAG: hypothetical protein HYX41_08090, partial [Bdellovibrio sp.]|nr:hypothetical protein [Bdellovibrio sp.]